MKDNVSDDQIKLNKESGTNPDFSIDDKSNTKQSKTDTFDKIVEGDASFDQKRNLFFEKQMEQAQNIEERLAALLTEVYKEPQDKTGTRLHIVNGDKKGQNTGNITFEEEPKAPQNEEQNPLQDNSFNKEENPLKDNSFEGESFDDGEKFRTATFNQLSKRNREKSIRQKIFTVGTTLLLSFVFVFLCANLFFKVDRIIIDGNKIYTDEVIAEYGQLKSGKSLLTMRGGAIENSITKNLPFINSAKVKKRLPKTIILEIKECSTVFYIKLADSYVIVSDGLKVIDITDKVPTSFKKYGNIREVKVNGIKRAVVSEKIQFYDEETESRLLNVIRAVENSNISDGTELIDVRSFYDIKLKYEGRFDIMLGSMVSMDEKIETSFRLMKKFREGAGGKIYVEYVKEGYVVPDDPADIIG